MAVMAAAEAGGDPAAAPESICSSGECPGLSRVAAAAAAAGRGGESAAGLGSAEGLGQSRRAVRAACRLAGHGRAGHRPPDGPRLSRFTGSYLSLVSARPDQRVLAREHCLGRHQLALQHPPIPAVSLPLKPVFSTGRPFL